MMLDVWMKLKESSDPIAQELGDLLWDFDRRLTLLDGNNIPWELRRAEDRIIGLEWEIAQLTDTCRTLESKVYALEEEKRQSDVFKGFGVSPQYIAGSRDSGTSLYKPKRPLRKIMLETP